MQGLSTDLLRFIHTQGDQNISTRSLKNMPSWATHTHSNHQTKERVRWLNHYLPFQAMLTYYLSLWPYHQLINSHLLLSLLMFLNLLTTDQVMYSQPKLRTCFEFSVSILSPPKMLPVISLGWKSDLELVTRLFNHILLHIENRFFRGIWYHPVVFNVFSSISN